MTSMFHDIRRTIVTTASRSFFSTSRILNMLGISRAWYYRQLHLPPIIDKRFNPFEVKDEETRVLKCLDDFPELEAKSSYRTP
ncbi:MAG: hypothetical protein QXP36_14925 [Conexivisphaerales archaeon]